MRSCQDREEAPAGADLAAVAHVVVGRDVARVDRADPEEVRVGDRAAPALAVRITGRASEVPLIADRGSAVIGRFRLLRIEDTVGITMGRDAWDAGRLC